MGRIMRHGRGVSPTFGLVWIRVQVEDNVTTWNAPSNWRGAEESWSRAWGSVNAQWWGSLRPRLHDFLPAGRILELGPGHGRWTHFLKDMCNELILVDVAEQCISTCRSRFAEATNIDYHVNDGKSLSVAADHSVDLVFSFDSLVHAEADVLDAYAGELARILTPDGIAIIHHSNMREHRTRAALAHRVPERWRWRLIQRGLLVNVNAWRAESVSARWFASTCEARGLCCIGQERIAWEFGSFLMDAITVVTPRGSRWERPTQALDNPRFFDEARAVARYFPIYASGSDHDGNS